MLAVAKRLNYALVRRFLGFWARPTLIGVDGPPSSEVVYALSSRSLTDVVLLDIVADRQGWQSPLSALADLDESRCFFFLNRPAGFWRRNTMRSLPPRLLRLETKLAATEGSLSLVPISVFWGRAANKERSLIRSLFSEGWAVSSRLRRFMVLLLNRRDILVHVGEPLPWPGGAPARQGAAGPLPPALAARRTARLLRVKFRNQKVATLGPDLSHRRTLVDRILRSPQVAAAITAEAGERQRDTARRTARKAAHRIAANLSYITLRFLDVLLTWFWHRIYDGVQVYGIERIATLAETHTLVYTPCHRSHIDYLLLSYILYQRGFMVPHVAAGDNLDLPLVGGVLRRGGAFFMRRSFQGDRLYSAVFSEYLYQVFRRGHAVEYFVEGGRTRTGRLLSPRTGVLQMTIDVHRRGVPRPIAFVPVYIGYDKLVEATSYADELRGGDKKTESVGSVFRNLRLVRQSFGTAQLVFGEPIMLEALLNGEEERPARLVGTKIVRGINACAFVNATNLVALTTLSMPRQAIDEAALVAQVDVYRDLIRRDAEYHDYRVTDMPAEEIVRHAEKLGLLHRESGRGGSRDAHIMSHDGFTAVLMTWYRNNVLHALAAPAFIACLTVNRRMGIRRVDVRRLFAAVYPYVERELQGDGCDDVDRWLDHLLAVNLVELRGNAFFAPRDPASRFRLRLLANTVMPVIERFYICVSLLCRAGVGELDRTTLLAEWSATARRISRLYGLNSPEFSDPRLIDGFLQQLSENGVLRTVAGKLEFDERLPTITRAAQGVIAVELRQALAR